MIEKDSLRVLYIRPKRVPQIVEIEETLDAMERLVNGNIEEYMPFDDDVAIICNAEGKYRKQELNRAIYDSKGKISDVIAGDFFLCYAPADSENYLSMPPELMQKYWKRFKIPEHFAKSKGKLQVFPCVPIKDDFER